MCSSDLHLETEKGLSPLKKSDYTNHSYLVNEVIMSAILATKTNGTLKLVGFEHEKPAGDRDWKSTRWDLVDLSHFQVKLKAEFQGSNRDMYRPEAIVATSGK